MFLNSFKKTGEVHFQFDGDDSILVADIMDYKECTIMLKQSKQTESGSIQIVDPSIEFTNGNGKSFKIFIKPTKEHIKIFSRTNKLNKLINPKENITYLHKIYNYVNDTFKLLSKYIKKRLHKSS